MQLQLKNEYFSSCDHELLPTTLNSEFGLVEISEIMKLFDVLPTTSVVHIQQLVWYVCVDAQYEVTYICTSALPAINEHTTLTQYNWPFVQFFVLQWLVCPRVIAL